MHLIVSLHWFICKLADEIRKGDNDEVEFQYKQGTDTYERYKTDYNGYIKRVWKILWVKKYSMSLLITRNGCLQLTRGHKEKRLSKI